MSSIAERVVRTFLAPPVVAVARPQAAVVPAVAVVGPPRLAPGVATTLALLLATRHRGTALVARWATREAAAVAAPGRVVTPAARGVAGRLQAQGLPAIARGRVVDVLLGPDHPGAVLVQAQTAAGVPAVLVLTTPRDDATDAALVAQDAIVIVGGGDGPLTELALASLQRLGPPVAVCSTSDSPLVRLLAGSALFAPPGWRRALGPVLEDLS
jgi:hypothetical protein